MAEEVSQQNGCLENPLYDPEILYRLDPSKFKGEYSEGLSPLKPGGTLRTRPLCLDDYEKGYMELLSQLTAVGEVSKERFTERFNKMKACVDTYFITVIEDVKLGIIVGTVTLVVEQKFIHGATARARLEDLVINDAYRGRQLGKMLLDIIVVMSEVFHCYKGSLECKDHLVKLYSQYGFEKTPGQNYMQQKYFD
ncbi:glucosamine 6-phosphate N-acetyltransferase [Aplysia californica]|uniref:Glucosamine 6-phosphate N-acetyltransferase n=1 Tax=Aplysia californica TaxID=6500 RepID=A0ABM0K064_APLCA|nr:glucosamine 6-phosphate N-acetyltransferase [Aplysia californica]